VAVSYRLRTTASYFDGSQYKFGNAVLGSVHGQYRPISEIAIDLGVDGRFAWADRSTDPDGTVTNAVGNTGGAVLSLAPGVYGNPYGALWVFLRGQIPFYTNLNGVQNVLPSATVGFQYQVL